MQGTRDIHVDEASFRHILGHFASGVVAVTGFMDETPVGFTCQSFFSLSLRPPLVAIASSEASTTWPRIEESGLLCINVLDRSQEMLARRFALSGADKFANVQWIAGPGGIPHLAGALAWIDCELESVAGAGDHRLAIARVVSLKAAGGDPLLFYRGEYRGLR